MISRVVVSSVLFLISCIIAPAIADDGAGEVTVEGFVRDSASKPIAGVNVTLSPLGKASSTASVRSGKDGEYKFKRKVSTTYDLFFTHSAHDPSYINLLAEGKDQKISVKLYRRGEIRPAVACLDSIGAAERLLILISTAEENDRKGLLAEYASSGSVAFLRTSSIDAITADLPLEAKNYIHKRRDLVDTLQLRFGFKSP